MTSKEAKLRGVCMHCGNASIIACRTDGAGDSFVKGPVSGLPVVRGAAVTESQIQDAIRLELGRDPSLVLWRNNCGSAVMPSRGGGRPMRVTFGVGNPGGADLLGIFNGRFVAIEIKTPTGRQSPEQRAFQQLVERKGGVYVVLRSIEDARMWLTTMHARAA